MAQTRPRLEQITFKSAKTGAHNIDTYLEAAELGNRTLAQLMGDLFDDNGNFAPEEILPEFRIDQTGGETKLQYATDGTNFQDLIGFFNDRGAFSTSTSFKALDLVTITTGQVIDLYIVKSDIGTVASQSAFIADSRTQLLNTSSAGILADVEQARDDVLQDAGFIAVSTDLQATPSKIETVSDNLGTGQPVTVVGADLALNASSNINRTGNDIANVNLVGPNIASVNTVAPHVGAGQDVTVVADDLNLGATSKIKLAADNIDKVTTVADDLDAPTSAITTVANDLNATPSNIANFVGGLDATIDDLTIQGVAKGAIDSTSNTTFDMSTANNYVFDRANGATLTLSNAHLCANMQPFTVVIKENGSSSLTISATTGTIKYANNIAPALDGVSGRLVILTGFVLDPDTVTPANTTIVVCHAKVYN